MLVEYSQYDYDDQNSLIELPKCIEIYIMTHV